MDINLQDLQASMYDLASNGSTLMTTYNIPQDELLAHEALVIKASSMHNEMSQAPEQKSLLTRLLNK